MTRTTILYILLVVVAGIAVLGWMRPVEVITTEDPYRAKFDSLQAVLLHEQFRSDSAMKAADYWHWVAEVLAAKRTDVGSHVRDAERALRNADVDSLRSVLMQRPR
jgi:hypothetical protein